MTRVASGHPDIWLDICRENQTAIIEAIDAMIDGLTDMRKIVDETDSRIAVWFSRQMSSQMSGCPLATRVMSRKPPAARRITAA
ncbi:MAG: prephenate dehydrogenase dimerization domain-containing protein [Actinomycetota bacterium]